MVCAGVVCAGMDPLLEFAKTPRDERYSCGVSESSGHELFPRARAQTLWTGSGPWASVLAPDRPGSPAPAWLEAFIEPRGARGGRQWEFDRYSAIQLYGNVASSDNEDGAFVEPGGCNRWQSVANRIRPEKRKTKPNPLPSVATSC